jgi:hypothetical protein
VLVVLGLVVVAQTECVQQRYLLMAGLEVVGAVAEWQATGELVQPMGPGQHWEATQA